MTVFGAQAFPVGQNAVSNLHGYVSRRMWGPTFGLGGVGRRNPHRTHNQRRTRPELAGVAKCSSSTIGHFAADWMKRLGEPDVWQGIHDVDPGELWGNAPHAEEFPAGRSSGAASAGQCRPPRRKRRGPVEAARNMLDP